MTYRVPLNEILFSMTHAAGMDRGVADGIYTDLSDGFAATILEQAASFAEGVLEPINRQGDLAGAKLADGVVTTAPGWKQAYGQWIEGGWAGVTASQEAGGMGLPHLLDSACLEMWSSANMSFMLCPMLSSGAILALERHGSEALQKNYLPKIVSGEWSATMNLTEPQAGSDLGALRTRADRQADGTYRIFGQKIFITYGEHDMAENIVHLVLARLPDAPAGTRGISLFLVPKYLPNGSDPLGTHNDVRCHSLEHKMGIHASPTCTMIYGDQGGAVGYLVGEENRGLACMFTMMNNARLGVGLQGVALAELATQKAIEYANERRQGRATGFTGQGMSPIALHPDVRRMLMTMKSCTAAARAICYMTAEAIDRSHRAGDAQAQKQASERASLLTPVAKAFSTDIGNEVTSLGVQVHGGMGFIEETGAAQFMRDARIAAIYEGTNGIQAIDLVQRKLPLSNGDTVAREIADMRAVIAEVSKINDPAFGATAARLGECIDALESATRYMLEALTTRTDDALAGATPYLRLFGLARGGTALARMALAALNANGREAHIDIARFFAENLCVGAKGLEWTVTGGAASVHTAERALAS
ncbi:MULTISPECIES: acyl-CoA dehydrogenase [unclassified Beijerinckia]|uniref:acyl-CoA dehydrogenase n=1 Tax=unclassified Beijerinckia TaxID=2638183 RepID=UPI000898B1DE|nr:MULTISPECIES: acyl-CoA dehydrogenase [unclassified Beijerinckia]MDH7796671.1 acyl-CoA dehydrogenase [Beijerinckia sp. GAS462]SEC55031.1 butyryl-CoA dehydrogenase [Beijerinckia sp. 28-YEA-48]